MLYFRSSLPNAGPDYSQVQNNYVRDIMTAYDFLTTIPDITTFVCAVRNVDCEMSLKLAYYMFILGWPVIHRSVEVVRHEDGAELDADSRGMC